MNSSAIPARMDPLFTRQSLSVGVAMVLACGAALYLQGQPAWCKYGFGIWANAWTHCTSQQLADPYSLSHVLHGVLLFWLLKPLAGRMNLRWRLILALAIEISWELFENSPWVIERYREQTASLDYFGDSIINSLVDIGLAIVGFAVAARFSWKVSIALFVVLELMALLMARDNLTLNIVMLVHPIDAIKDWQLAR